MKNTLKTLVPSFIAVLATSTLIAISVSDLQNSIIVIEGGVIEIASAAGYFVCIAYILYLWGSAAIKRYYYALILLLFFGFRELDFDKRFTTMGILKARFYSSDAVPIVEKIIGIAIVALILFSLFKIISNHLRALKYKTQLTPNARACITSAVAFIFYFQVHRWYRTKARRHQYHLK